MADLVPKNGPEYWRFLEKTAAEVAKWPSWKTGEGPKEDGMSDTLVLTPTVFEELVRRTISEGSVVISAADGNAATLRQRFHLWRRGLRATVRLSQEVSDLSLLAESVRARVDGDRLILYRPGYQTEEK